jgi:hypothetical protein
VSIPISDPTMSHKDNAAATSNLNAPEAEPTAPAVRATPTTGPKHAVIILEGQRILEDLPIEEARDEKFLRLMLEPHYPLAVSAEFHYSEKGDELVVEMIKIPDPKGGVRWPAGG